MNFNNVFQIRIDSMDDSCTLQTGNTLNVSAQANTKSLGGSGPIGDASCNVTGGANLYIDPDVADSVVKWFPKALKFPLVIGGIDDIHLDELL